MPRMPSKDEIERRAYEIYEQRGCAEGHAEEDWFTAEHELNAQLASEERGEESQSRIRTAVVQAMQQSKSRNARSSRN